MGLTRSQCKVLSAEFPVGDPFGGPAYGERNDPGTVAVVGSVLSAANAAKSLFAPTKAAAPAPAPTPEAPKVMPSSDTAAQAALAAKKRAAATQGAGRASTLLSEGSSSNSLGG